MSRPTKTPSESCVTENVYKIFPNDLNAERTVFGGLVLALCDRTALIVAERHSGYSCVTASVDGVDFLAPARAGETLIVRSSINRAWRSSMEIGVLVLAENSISGQTRHVLSAYLTFVALDDEGNSAAVPAVKASTDIEKKRFRAAGRRRKHRLSVKQRAQKT